MQSIKNLGIKTKEGLEVKNYETFPSMEWGDDGGLRADIFFQGENVATVFQEGNGGCADVRWKTDDNTLKTSVNQAVLNCLLRNDPTYGPKSQYDWLRNKTIDSIDDDDYEAVVNIVFERRQLNKDLKKCLKAGNKALVNLIHEDYFHNGYINFPTIPTDKDIDAVLARSKAKREDYIKIETLTEADVDAAI